MPKLEADRVCEKRFGPKGGEATDSCAETLAADMLPVLPGGQQHSTGGFLSHCGEKYKTNTPGIRGRG